MLDWSFNLLSERERVVLSRLSVFVGDFTLGAACFLASDAGSYINGTAINVDGGLSRVV